MSVINKMLRDLDDRKASGTLQVRLQDGTEGIARDTQSIREGKGPQSGSSAGRLAGSSAPPWGAALVVFVVLAGGLAWWWHDRRPQTSVPAQQQPVPAEAVTPVITPAPAASSAGGTKGNAKALPGRSATELQAPGGAKAPEAPAASASKPAIPAVVARNVASLPLPSPEPSLRMDSVVRSGTGGSTPPAPASMAPQVVAPAAPVPATAPPSSSPPAGPRPSPVMEALAQAQALWSAGSRVGAIELLKDAIAVAERSPGTGGATLAALARELGRMELAEGRAAAALEMLTRLEPGLSGVADIWALRGNAAQRLGRHEESSNAYLTALKLKPGEPRWMLGAAVSLAAQGQTGAAAEWAEQARAAGALSREVASYLQQLGVPLRER